MATCQGTQQPQGGSVVGWHSAARGACTRVGRELTESSVWGRGGGGGGGIPRGTCGTPTWALDPRSLLLMGSSCNVA